MSRILKPRTILAALAEPQKRIQPVLARATQLVEAFEAELLLFHAAFESALSGRPYFDSKRLARARGWRLHQHTRALDRHAQKLRAQVLVMGAISRRGLRRLAVGDTAERTIHTSPCDLLILKPAGFALRLGRGHRESVILPAAGQRSRSPSKI